MNQIELQVSPRGVLGKKVRFLRRKGMTPVHLFGHNIESLALQTDTAGLQRILTQAGKTALINLTLDQSAKPRKVLVREVQREPVSGKLLHVDFYEVSMEEEIRMEIPIVLVGEAPALKLKENILSQELNTLDIECLPDCIPNRIEVDVSPLTEAGQEVRVKNITLDKGVKILNNPDVVIARVSVRKAEEEVRPPEAVAAEAAAPEAEAKPAEEAAEKPKAEKAKGE